LALARSGRADENKEGSCPMHAQHAKAAEDAHAAEVKWHGEEGMGFNQDSTRHHFRLLPDGGAIEVLVADIADVETRDQVRHHLAAITSAFAAGDFQLPMFIHSRTPPGVPAMRRLKARIAYSYEETPSGGRVRVVTRDKQALTAVHAFLRFQIRDHQTGDPTTIEP
jgi:hypothetical protein